MVTDLRRQFSPSRSRSISVSSASECVTETTADGFSVVSCSSRNEVIPGELWSISMTIENNTSSTEIISTNLEFIDSNGDIAHSESQGDHEIPPGETNTAHYMEIDQKVIDRLGYDEDYTICISLHIDQSV